MTTVSHLALWAAMMLVPAHAFADVALGAVFPRRVDVAVSGFQRDGNRFSGTAAELRGAKPDRRNRGAVRGEGGGGG